MINRKVSTSIAYSILLFSFVMPLLLFFNYKVDEMSENTIFSSVSYGSSKKKVRNIINASSTLRVNASGGLEDLVPKGSENN